jgi:hypothetical protein
MRGDESLHAMPLSHPASRKLLHLRDITLRGYERDDGQIDVEAHMTDTKSYSWRNRDRGELGAGEPIHDMWLRLTVDQAFNITGCEAAMDSTPHHICPGAAPNFARLVGLNVGKGFLKAASAAVGGVAGCTHLRDLLQQVGTVTWQTMFSIRDRAAAASAPKQLSPNLLNTCFAYDETGALVASFGRPPTRAVSVSDN